MDKKKYRLKKTDNPETKATPLVTGFSFEFIKKFVTELPTERILKIELPNRKVRSQDIERAPVELKPNWRAEEGEADILKKKLTTMSMNGGWTQSKIDQSRQSDRKVEAEIKFVLNLLAPDNYVRNFNRIKSLLSSVQMIEMFVRQLLLKVKFQNKYHSLYATLCHQLGRDKHFNTLMAILDSRLTESVRNVSAEEFTSVRSRKDFTMTVIFMGELFLQKVIRRQSINKITCHYVTEYLKKPEENTRYLETLIHLYSHIGQFQLKHPEQLKTSTDLRHLTPDACSFIITFEDVFQLFKQLTLQTGRIWSLVANVLEKRDNRWEKTIIPEETLHRSVSMPVNSVGNPSEIFPQDYSQTLIDAFDKVDIKALKKLCYDHQHLFLETFIVRFFRTKMTNITALISMVWELVDDGTIDIDDLWKAYTMKFQLIVLDQPDYPFTKKALCQLFCPYMKNNYFQISDLKQFVASEEQDEFVQSLTEMMEMEVQNQREN